MGRASGAVVVVGVLASLLALAGCTSVGRVAPITGGDGGGGGDGGLRFDEEDGGGPDLAACPRLCSVDGTLAIDCGGATIADCEAQGQVCIDGGCVDACEQARSTHSTVGCEYWSVDPSDDGEADGACFAAFIANPSPAAVDLHLDYRGKQYRAADFARIPTGSGANIRYDKLPGGKLPPGKVAILFLADWKDAAGISVHCPIPAAYTDSDAASEDTNLKVVFGFHITSSLPVIAYDIFPYGGQKAYISSATLLLPTSSWDTNYVAADPWAQSQASAKGSPFVQVVAAEDNTRVTVRPTADIAGGANVPASAANKNVAFTLAKGDVLQLKQSAELAGSAITADKPIGVWGGAGCFNIDVANCCCDSAHQELMPVKATGHSYVAVRYGDRQAGMVEAPPWRMVGMVAGTQLTYDPAPPVGAPRTLQRGQLATFYSSDPFVVSSQDKDHPFYLSGQMSGAYFGGHNYNIGDPEYVNVITPEQWLASYAFMTDPTMHYTQLVMVREVSGGELTFKNVVLDCLGGVTGWKPVGRGGQYEYARVDLVKGGQPVGRCDNGFHAAHSEAPFALTVWGWDEAVSYAYPAGAGLAQINDIVVQ